jgi:hypothetical protein
MERETNHGSAARHLKRLVFALQSTPDRVFDRTGGANGYA